MSKEMKKTLSWVTAAGVALAVGVFIFVLGSGSAAQPLREFRLVAKEMAFYLEGNPKPNPTLNIFNGEKVRLRFTNLDKGIDHDLVISSLALSTGKVAYGEEVILDFQPKQKGPFDYLCTLHEAMMKGRLVVLKNPTPKSEAIAQQ